MKRANHMFIKNPNYNPNDPKSKRYIQQADPLAIPPQQNMSVAPNASAAPRPTVNPPTTTPTSSKTSTPSGIPTTPVAPRVAAPAPQSTQNMSVAPQVASSAYTVKSGDTLGAIAARNGTTVQELQRLNPQITNPNLIQPGQTFKLPGAVAPTAPATPSAPPVQPAQPPAPTQPQQGANMPAPTPSQPGTPPPTGDQKTDQAMQNLAEQAGKAGMTLDQYLDVVNRSNAPTKEESDAIRNKLGIPDLIDDVFSKPEKSTTELYRELYDLGGLSDVKESVKKLDAEIAQKRADLVTATGELYNNPWISKATRSGRLGNLQRIALADIENSIAQKNQYLSLYDQGISEIEQSIARSQFDTGLDRDLTVEKLNYLLTEAERDEAFAQRAVEQRALRYLPDFLDSQPQESPEDFTLGEGQMRFDGTTGERIAYNPKAEEGQSQFMDKQLTPKEAADLGLPLGSTYADAARKQVEVKVDATSDVIGLIDSIMNDPALSALTGPVGSRLPSLKTLTGATGDLQKKVDRLANLITLENIDLMSGVLSETDIKILREGGTLINTSQRKGNFIEELDRLQSNALREQYRMLGITDATYEEAVEQLGKEGVRKVINTAIPQLLKQGNTDFSNVGSGTDQRLGELSERYESGGDPGAIGYDNTGGWSYGAYQLAHSNAQKFVQQSPYAKEFQGLTFNSEAWRNKWKEVAQKDPQNFKTAQKKYIEQTHFAPQVQKVASAGYDLNKYSNVLKDVVWSTAVQHGPNNNIVLNAMKTLGKNADEQSLIRKIYELRWGGGQNFARSTPNVKQSVYNRFFGQNGELAAALNKLNIG